MDISNNNISRLGHIINDYNDNINYYNSNMRILINSMTQMMASETTQINNHIRTPLFTTQHNSVYEQTPPMTQPYLPLYRPERLGYQLRYQPLRNLQEDVIVRPTHDHINTACEFYTHDNEMPENTCPISLLPFQDGDEVCRIRHCRHIFLKPSIMRWFRSSVRCPICRYDIREYVDLSGNTLNNGGEPEDPLSLNNEPVQNDDENMDSSSVPPSSTSETTNNSNTNYNPYRRDAVANNNVINRIGQSIENFITQELNQIDLDDSIEQLLYSFDIPIQLPLRNNIPRNTPDLSYNNTSL